MAARRDDPGEGRRLIGEALDLWLAYVLEALAMLGLAQGSPEQAMVAHGAAEGIRTRLDLGPWPSVQWVSDMLTQAADGMADPAAQAARLAGAQMDPIEAAQIALRRQGAGRVADGEHLAHSATLPPPVP